MAEPARFPTPRPRKPPVTPAETPASPGPVEPPGSRTQGLSRLPRDELLALAERDLPSMDELLAIRMQDLPRLPRDELLALTERDLPAIDDLAPPDFMFQDQVTIYTMLALWQGLEHHPDTYVASYAPVYATGRPDESGQVRPVWVVPDIVVSFGVGNHNRVSYVVWKEGKPPEFVMEFASPSTWRRDRDEKPALYESLGVREYFLFDPVGGLLEPRLQGHVLRDGRYRPMRLERLPNGERGLRSEVLGLWAYPEGPGQTLRWHDPVTGKDLEDHHELRHARKAAEARAAEETAARETAEARAAEETAARETAEARAAEETAAREAAEAWAAEETAAREAVEARAAEETAAREAAEARVVEAVAARTAAEEELADLRAQVRRLRNESGP